MFNTSGERVSPPYKLIGLGGLSGEVSPRLFRQRVVNVLPNAQVQKSQNSKYIVRRCSWLRLELVRLPLCNVQTSFSVDFVHDGNLAE